MRALVLTIVLGVLCSGCYVTSAELEAVRREWREADVRGDERAKTMADISLEEMHRRQKAFEDALEAITAQAPGVLGAFGTPTGAAGAISGVAGAIAAYAAARRKSTQIAEQQRQLVKMEINAERDRKYVDAAKSIKVEPEQAT